MKLRLPEQNNVMLVGRLTRDPELRFTPKGQAVCNFDLAVNRRYKDMATGQWMDDTSFVPIVVWAQAAQRCGERLKKGSPAFVQGRLRSRSWETKEGQKRTTLEVVAQRVQFLEAAEMTGGPVAHEEEVETESEGARQSEEAPRAVTARSGRPAVAAPSELPENEEVPF